MYYLSCAEIERYAREIVERLGEDCYGEEEITSEEEYLGRRYVGYGLDIFVSNYDLILSIEYNGNLVYSDAEYYPDDWGFVLRELYFAVPKILARNGETVKSSFIKDCKEYLVEWKAISAVGGEYFIGSYEDDLIKIRVDSEGMRIYVKTWNFWRFWKSGYDLVYAEEKVYGVIHGRMFFNEDGFGWRKHLEEKIAEKKREILQKQIDDELIDDEIYNEAWQARMWPTAEEYIRRLRDL